MLLRVNLFDHLFDNPLFINNEGCPYDPGDLFTVHNLLSVGSVGRHDLPVRVGNQGEGQAVLFSETSVRLLTVRTDSQNDESLPEELLIIIPETACLCGATGSVVLRVKIKYYFFAGEAAEFHIVSVLVIATELRGRHTGGGLGHDFFRIFVMIGKGMKLSSFAKYLRLRVINTRVGGLVPGVLLFMLIPAGALSAQNGVRQPDEGVTPAQRVRGEVTGVPDGLFRVLGESVELRHTADSLALRAEKAAQVAAAAPEADRERMEKRAAAEAAKAATASAGADSLLLSPSGVTAVKDVSGQEGRNAALFEVRSGPEYSDASPVPVEPSMPQGLIYTVQIATFRNNVSPSLFRGLWPVYGRKRQGSEAVYYYTGMFRRMEEARKALPEARGAGFPDAFIIAFMNGVQVSLERAALLESDWSSRPIAANGLLTGRDSARPVAQDQSGQAGQPGQPNLQDRRGQPGQPARSQSQEKAINPVPVGTLFFRAEVMRIDKPIKPEVTQKIEQLAGTRGLDMVKNNNGETVFLIGNFITFESADEYVSLLIRNGYNSARVAAYVGLQEIPVEAARELINKLPDD